MREAGERSGERCWPLPLWPEYREQLDSDVADMKNVGALAVLILILLIRPQGILGRKERIG